MAGSSPVDGSATQVSSTHSELHGFAAPLEYIHQLARYYSTQLKGEYEWECDSQCALNRIGVLLKFTQRRRQPYNTDIISNLTHRLGQTRSMTIKSTWVKAHQDEKKLPGQVLPEAALGNIKVDSIAEDYLLDSRQPQTSENSEHVIIIQEIYFRQLLLDRAKPYLSPAVHERVMNVSDLLVGGDGGVQW